MSIRRSVAMCAFAIVVAMSSALPSGAQFGGRGAPLYAPEPGARDLKAVLFNWAWHMGMLRGQAEPELIQTLEYRSGCTRRFGISHQRQLPDPRIPDPDPVHASERRDVLEY